MATKKAGTKKTNNTKTVPTKKNEDNASNVKTIAIVVLAVLVGVLLIALLVTRTPRQNISGPIEMKQDRGKNIQGPTTQRADKTVTVHNDDGDYKFETDASYIVSQYGSRTSVYTSERRVMPYFAVSETSNYTRRTIPEFLDGVIESTKTRYQNRLTGEPEKTTVEINGETVHGIKYAYSTESGEKTIYIDQFMMVLDSDDFYTWTCNAYEEKSDTLEAMFKAMASFGEEDS